MNERQEAVFHYYICWALSSYGPAFYVQWHRRDVCSFCMNAGTIEMQSILLSVAE